MNLISSETIQSTFTYIELGKIDPKHPGLNNKMRQQMLLKRSSREILTHQLILHRNGKPIEPVLNRYQLAVLNELIEAEKEINNRQAEGLIAGSIVVWNELKNQLKSI